MWTATGLALDWLTHSDIRRANGGSLGRGGVNQGYNWRERSYPFIYSEITGYAISAYVNAYRWTGNELYLAVARESAEFLLRVQNLSKEYRIEGAVPHSLSLPHLTPLRRYYSFDSAMCLQGLLDLNTVHPVPALRESARGIGDWLVHRMQRPDGAFISVVDGITREDRPDGDEVFGDGGSLHAKHAIGLLKLSDATGDHRYAVASQQVCDWVLCLQDNDGAFHATEQMEQVVSHSHCYATEGLLFAHDALGAERYGEAARRAAEWLLSIQNRDGSINIAYKRRWWRMGRRITEKMLPRRVSDATAQAVRIWLALFYLDGDDRFLRASRRAADYLRRAQCTSSPDHNALGGLTYWPGHPMMYAWCTMFALNAIHAVEHVDREHGYQCMLAELF